MEDLKIIGVQFTPVGKHYHFSIPEEAQLSLGDAVIVNTSRGLQLGTVAALNVDPKIDGPNMLKVERLATEEDFESYKNYKKKAKEAIDIINRFLREGEFGEIKAVDAEYTLDGAKMTIYLTYEQNVEFDVRSFLRDISYNFNDTRLEVRQVGPRDAAKMISGLGACGIEKRCCSRFLTEFTSISIKMAKAQDISLTPTEITGICGRLRCCLRYENETYEAALQELPKRKKKVMTPLGEGRVTQVLPLRGSVIVNIPEIGPRQFTQEELETGVLQVKPVVFDDIPDEYNIDHSDVELLNIEPERKPKGRRNSKQTKREGERKERAKTIRSDSEKPGPETTQNAPAQKKREDGGKRNYSRNKRRNSERTASKNEVSKDKPVANQPAKNREQKPSRKPRSQRRQDNKR
ncbi:MAG TPA: regulatory iron-sulfur-containing complex subunit RicT [Anaerolineaceae bacterium]|nr:regulatory iron-sulfur-containing complex subunit RicT [Anaerolineaceae bacterium]